MKQGFVLSLCDRTGVMVRPWAIAGYRCVCVDLEGDPTACTFYPGGGSILHVRQDVFDYRLPYADPVQIAFGFPPCTDLAGSGAKHWARKGLTRCVDALRLVDHVRQTLEMTDAPWMVENPVGRLSTCWRKPDHIFHPCDYGGYLSPPGDAYRKKTCLWTGGGFVLPEPRPVVAEGVRKGQPSQWYSRVGGSDSPAKKFLRSVTPAGFALAVFLANKGE